MGRVATRASSSSGGHGNKREACSCAGHQLPHAAGVLRVPVDGAAGDAVGTRGANEQIGVGGACIAGSLRRKWLTRQAVPRREVARLPLGKGVRMQQYRRTSQGVDRGATLVIAGATLPAPWRRSTGPPRSRTRSAGGSYKRRQGASWRQSGTEGRNLLFARSRRVPGHVHLYRRRRRHRTDVRRRFAHDLARRVRQRDRAAKIRPHRRCARHRSVFAQVRHPAPGLQRTGRASDLARQRATGLFDVERQSATAISRSSGRPV